MAANCFVITYRTLVGPVLMCLSAIGTEVEGVDLLVFLVGHRTLDAYKRQAVNSDPIDLTCDLAAKLALYALPAALFQAFFYKLTLFINGKHQQRK